MGDWSDCYDAFGYDISHIEYAKPKRRKRGKKVTATLNESQLARYKALGGAKWLKAILAATKETEPQ